MIEGRGEDDNILNENRKMLKNKAKISSVHETFYVNSEFEGIAKPTHDPAPRK